MNVGDLITVDSFVLGRVNAQVVYSGPRFFTVAIALPGGTIKESYFQPIKREPEKPVVKKPIAGSHQWNAGLTHEEQERVKQGHLPKIISMRAAGVSYAEIGNVVGISERTVRHWYLDTKGGM